MRCFRYALLAMLLVSLLGCRAPRPTTRLVIGVRTANDHAPFYIADRQQLYRQHALDVTVRLVASNTAIIEGLQRGDFQMGAVPVTTAIAAIAQGSPLHIVAMTGRGSDGLLVRADSGITSLANLRGKKIATIRASILDVLLRQALEQSGMNPDRDVELVYMSTLGDMIAALKTGQVEATSNTEPFLTDAERQGWGRILTYYTAFWPEHPCCVVVARDDLAQNDPRTLRAVLAAHCEAVAWANAHPAETAQIIVDTLQAYDAVLVEESLSRTRMHIDYLVAPDEIERMAALMASQGLIARAPSRASLLSLGPLSEALSKRP